MAGRPHYIYNLTIGMEVVSCDKKQDILWGRNEVSLRLTEYNNPEFEYFPPNNSTLIVLEESRHKVVCRFEPGIRKYWCNRSHFLLFTRKKV